MVAPLMTDHTAISNLDEDGLKRLAERTAFYARSGDLVLLEGDLGAGKTTFARAMLHALGHPLGAEVPSPTFTIVQHYQTPRAAVAHYDLYRVAAPRELDELGLEDALLSGIVIVEWPEKGGDRLNEIAARTPVLKLSLSDAAGDTRNVDVTAAGSWTARLERLDRLTSFLAKAGRLGEPFAYLQGDASVRRYARLQDRDGLSRVLMDWPHQPDGPVIRDGLPYSRLAQLAEGVRPFVAIAHALQKHGVAVPAIESADLDAGFLLMSDLGDDVFATLVRAGASQAPLWQGGVDLLARLRSCDPPAEMTLADGSSVTLPRYGARALSIETELLLDWYWPAVHGALAPDHERRAYLDLWQRIFERLDRLPEGWVLRDYHSPNLLKLSHGGSSGVGVIDFQDAQRGPHAYDLVSLLQDARVDVGAELEAAMLDRYIAAVRSADASFDEVEFRWSYAAMGAQRNAKILGIFARLAHRDGKPGYLAHIPRLWKYLARDLAHPELAGLAAWFDAAFPPAIRGRAIPPQRPY